MARRRRRHRRKGRFAFLYKLMTFLLICGALVAALALFFKVESIEITGTSRYSTDEVERASGVHVGDNLYLMDKNAVASRITQQLPYVETVQISRRLPKTLCISVTECRGLAAIEQDGRLWLISEGGKLVDTAPADDAAQYAVSGRAGKKLLRKLRTTYIPEEFYFQNVFSGTAFEPRIVNRELHFSIWNEPERGLPAVLNMGDLEKMSASDCCFARKVDVDSELGRALLERWNG